MDEGYGERRKGKREKRRRKRGCNQIFNQFLAKFFGKGRWGVEKQLLSQWLPLPVLVIEAFQLYYGDWNASQRIEEKPLIITVKKTRSNGRGMTREIVKRKRRKSRPGNLALDLLGVCRDMEWMKRLICSEWGKRGIDKRKMMTVREEEKEAEWRSILVLDLLSCKSLQGCVMNEKVERWAWCGRWGQGHLHAPASDRIFSLGRKPPSDSDSPEHDVTAHLWRVERPNTRSSYRYYSILCAKNFFFFSSLELGKVRLIY